MWHPAKLRPEIGGKKAEKLKGTKAHTCVSCSVLSAVLHAAHLHISGTGVTATAVATVAGAEFLFLFHFY